MDRRAIFFLCAAALCAVLIPLADESNRWVAEVTAAVYVVLAVLSWLDHWSRARPGTPHDRVAPPAGPPSAGAVSSGASPAGAPSAEAPGVDEPTGDRPT